MLRWIKRIVFGLVALIALAIVGTIVFVNTDYGRNKLRLELAAQLDNVFAHGVTVRKVEGTPFGELVLRDVVINGPDEKPAIMIGTLRLRVRLIDLMRKDVRLGEVIAEDVDVQARRDAQGRLQITELLKKKVQAADPPPPPTKMTWNIDLPKVELHRVHLLIDTGTTDLQVVNLDGLEITGAAHIPAEGPRTASLNLSGTWRERGNTHVSVAVEARDTVEMLSVPKLAIAVGGVTLTGADVEIVMRDGQLPLVGGSTQLVAPAAAVALILPRYQLPGDITLKVASTRGVMSGVSVAGSLGTTPIHANLVADLDRLRATGSIEAGELDLAQWTRGRIVAVAAGKVVFDAQRGPEGMLPTATLAVTAHGTYQELPRSDFAASIATHGNRIATHLDVSGGAKATIVADLERAGETLMLERGSIVATVDPSVASGGRVPVRGGLAIDLHGHGMLSPTQDLAVSGTVTSRTLRVQDLSVASSRLTLNATDLPRHPRGTARLQLVSLVRGAVQLGALDVDATTRPDDRIAVNITSHPVQAPWLVELAALVTPPASDGTVVVDLLQHHIRAGNGGDWRGANGRVVIGPQRVDVRGLTSANGEGKLALSGSFGRATGNVTASVDLQHFALQTVDPGYRGTASGHVEAARTGGLWSGTADVTGTALQLDPSRPALDLAAKVAAKPGSVTLAATASSPKIGGAKLALDLDAPSHLEDARAWRARGRGAIRSAQLELQHLDIAQLAALAGQKATGTLDGQIALTPTTVSGALHVRKLTTPALRGVKSTDADLELAQSATGELDPTLTVTLAEVGKIVAKAQIATPTHVLDPAAWNAKLLRGAQIQTDKIVLDPALFDRFGIASTLRGTASLRVELGPEARTATLTGDVRDVRGTQLAKPVDIHFVAGIDGKAATATLGVTTNKQTVTLLQIDAKVPVSLDQLRANPAGVRALPLTATVTLKETSAPALLALVGRNEVTGGKLDGTITVTGTVGTPAVRAQIVASDIEVPPGPRGKPVQRIEKLALDATWSREGGGKLAIDGTEAGGGALTVRAEGRDLATATGTIKATHFNLTPLLAFAPGPAGGSRATIDADVSLKGFDMRTAQLLGDVHLKDARIPISPAVGTLREANIDITVHAHDIAIATTGKLGAGTVVLKGSIATDGASLTGGNATITLRKVSPIGAVQPVIDADVTAKLARKGETWTADLVVDKGFVKIASTKGEKLKDVGLPPDLTVGRGKRKVPTGPPPPPPAPFVIAHIILHDTKVESQEFRTTLHGDITATADARTIGLVGKIEALGGDLDLFDRRYVVDTAAVYFDGTIDPLLEIRFTHDFPDVETITEVRGRLSQPQLILSSNPGSYSKSQLLGFLLGGEPNGDPNSAGAKDKATAAGESLIASQIGNYVKKALPFDLDVLRYEAAGATSSAAITVGSWVTHTLFVAFREHLSPRPDENSGEATVEYWLTKRLEVEATAGDRSYDGVDLLWRKRF